MFHCIIKNTSTFHPLESTCKAEALDHGLWRNASLMFVDKLMINNDKTEFLVIGTSKQLPYSYLISPVFNFAIFAIVKKSRN